MYKTQEIYIVYIQVVVVLRRLTTSSNDRIYTCIYTRQRRARGDTAKRAAQPLATAAVTALVDQK